MDTYSYVHSRATGRQKLPLALLVEPMVVLREVNGTSSLDKSQNNQVIKYKRANVSRNEYTPMWRESSFITEVGKAITIEPQ